MVNTLQAPAPAPPAAGAGEARPVEGPAREAVGGGSFGASMHAQALARRRAMGDEPRPRVRAPSTAYSTFVSGMLAHACLNSHAQV